MRGCCVFKTVTVKFLKAAFPKYMCPFSPFYKIAQITQGTVRMMAVNLWFRDFKP